MNDETKVVITVQGGVAEVVEAPNNVKVVIVDYDNLDDAVNLHDIDPHVVQYLAHNDPDELIKIAKRTSAWDIVKQDNDGGRTDDDDADEYME